MTERAQALEALKRVARDIGTVKDVASRRSDPDRDNRRMLARLSAWRSEILRALNILEAVPPRPPVGSPTTPDMGQGWFVTAGRWGDSIVTIEEKSLSGKPDFTPEDQALVRGAALHLLAFIGQPTPVEPAGASESPSEMDSGIVLLVSAASAASGYLERQQPDLAAWLWNAVQLVLNSQSAPVSPVEPTPGCGCDLCRAPQGSAILTTIHAPTGEPAPCVWRDIRAEVEKATAKFPTWPTDPLHALAVLGEEFGELTKATVQQTYEPHKNAPGELRKEAIQTAAMALRFAMSLDVYEVQPSAQHAQGHPLTVER